MNKFKVGDCVIYIEKGGYWKVFKILEVRDGYYKYKCLDGIVTKVIGEVAFFHASSFVGIRGMVVNESDYMSYVVAKGL